MHIKKISRKWVSHEPPESHVEIRETYLIPNLKNYNQQKTCLKHTVTIDETIISFYSPPEKDQTREWLRKGQKLISVIVADIYEPK